MKKHVVAQSPTSEKQKKTYYRSYAGNIDDHSFKMEPIAIPRKHRGRNTTRKHKKSK
jgi:hypothetical protein